MNGAAVILREWETLRPDAGGPLAHRTLSNEANRKLAEQLSDHGSIEVLELARGLEIRATSFVGRLTLGEVTVTIQPKLSGAPFINLLRYAYDLRHLDLYEPVGYATEKWAFQDLLIQQLAAEVRELLARGVHREYDRTCANLANPRGRIEFDRLAGMTQWTSAALPCVHYPRTDDTLLNQVVLAGLAYASRLTTNVDLRAHLTRLMKVLNTTVSLKELSVNMLNEARQIIDRRTTVYTPALIVIQLLLQAEGVSLDDASGRVRLPGFLFDMNRFFQALISRFLHDHLESYEIQDEYRLKELFCYDPELNPRRRRAPIQKPDFVIRRGRTDSSDSGCKIPRSLGEAVASRDAIPVGTLCPWTGGGETKSGNSISNSDERCL